VTPAVPGLPNLTPILLRPMPIYEYRCDNGHLFEVMQRMSDGPVTVCETCEAPVQRVFHPVAVHFKGSGFYNTDYGTAKRKRETDASAKAGADSNDAKSKASKDSKSSDGSKSSSDSSSSSSSSSASSSSGSGSGSGSGDKS
jgi:putative FmdB family regulatory protein